MCRETQIMIQIHKAQKLTDLADLLYEKIQSERELNRSESDPAGLFSTHKIVVPNRNLRRWLQIYFADHHTCTAGLHFQFLEQALFPEKEADYLSVPFIQLLMIQLFQRILSGDVPAGFEAFRSYLEEPADGDESRVHIKMYQLSARLASYFQDYRYHRTEWIEAWKEGKNVDPSVVPAGFDPGQYSALVQSGVFQSQQLMFQMLFAGLQNRACQHRDGQQLTGNFTEGSNLYLFGLSQISRYHLSRIQKLSEKLTIEFFFPDCLYRSEAVFAGWAKAGHEMMKLTQEAGIPVVEAEGTAKKDLADIQIMAAPSIRREIESVHQSIIWNMTEGPLKDTLKLTDIAVLVTDMNTYRPFIESVFDSLQYKEDRLIPYNLTDFSAAADSLYLAAVQFITSVDSVIYKEDLLLFIENPCFLKRAGLSAEDVPVFKSWIDKTGVFLEEEVDPKNANEAGSGIYFEPYRFSRMLSCLRLGTVMDTDSVYDSLQQLSYSEAGLSGFGNIPYEDQDTEDQERLYKFCMYLDELFRQRLTVKNKYSQDPVSLLNYIDEFLDPSGSGETRLRNSFQSGIRIIEEAGAVPYEVAVHFLTGQVRSIAGSKGQYLCGGVTISALQPMRPIPFKIVYITGLTEGSFPGNRQEDPLSLRSLYRTGDVEPADANRYLFLETMLSVSDRLYLTYVSEDLEKQSSKLPSSLIIETEEMLRSQGLKPEKYNVTVPLRLSSSRYVFQDFERKDLKANYIEKDLRLALSRFSAEDRNPSKDHRPVLQLPENTQNSGQISISTAQLKRYYRKRLDEAYRYHARVSGFKPDDTALEFPVQYGKFLKQECIRSAVFEYWNDSLKPDSGRSLRSILEQQTVQISLRSDPVRPTGVFLQLELDEMELQAKTIFELLQQLCPVKEPLYTCRDSEDELILTADDFDIRLYGQPPAATASGVLPVIVFDSVKTQSDKYKATESYIDFMFLAAKAPQQNTEIRWLLISSKGEGFLFQPVQTSRQESEDYLKGLLLDLIARPDFGIFRNEWLTDEMLESRGLYKEEYIKKYKAVHSGSQDYKELQSYVASRYGDDPLIPEFKTIKRQFAPVSACLNIEKEAAAGKEKKSGKTAKKAKGRGRK